MSSPRRKKTKRQGKGTSARGSARTELYTLGGVRLVQSGSDQTAKLGPKHLALLIYLFHELRPMQPSEVTEVLGRGQEQEKELAALKKAAAWLSDNVPGVTIRVTADTIEASGNVWLDSRDVDASIDAGDPEPVEELYSGEFLERFESGSVGFDEWASKERGRLKRAWTHAMIAAAQKAEGQEDWETAADWWHILVARAPMRPEAVASLLRAYVKSGQEQKAGLAYAEYANRLEQSGIAQPAAPVRQVLAEHPALQKITGVHVELPAQDEVGVAKAGGKVPDAGAATPGEPKDSEWEEFIDLAAPAELDLALGREPVVPAAGDEQGAERPADLQEDAVKAGPSEPGLDPAGTQSHAGAEDLSKQSAEAGLPDADFEILPEEEVMAAKPPGGAFSDRRDELERNEPVDRPAVSAAGMVGALGGVAAATGRALGSVVDTVTGPRQERRQGLRPLVRRFSYAAVAVLVAALAFAFGPRLLGVVGGLTEELPEVDAPSVKVSLPKVTVPKLTLKTPAFVETSVSKIGEMLSGPILDEPGQWVLVADLDIEELGAAEGSAESGNLPEELTPESAPAILSPADTGGSAIDSAGKDVPRRSGPATDSADGGQSGAGPAEGEPGDAIAEATAPTDVAPAPSVDSGEAGDAAAGVTAPAEQAGDSAVPSARDVTGEPQDSAVPRESVASQQDRAGVTDQGPPAGQAVEAIEPVTAPRAELSLSAMGLALEAELSQASYFSVVPRERALTALSRLTGQPVESLDVASALALAESQGYGAVVSGQLIRREGPDSIKLQILSVQGDTLYGVAAELSPEMSRLETVVGLARAARRRFGEPEEDIAASLHPARVLTSSASALNAYAEAREHLYAGRYSQAVETALEATQLDTAFTMAYLVLADAYAQSGVRMRAHSALESAWKYRQRVPERERLRIEADRFAWDGRFSEAAVSYDELFQRYRDDVGALKSQALMQRMIGARGGGEGNLRVAYTIDRYDWPRLARIARYVGYTGPLPDVDSLVASLEPTAEEESNGGVEE